MTPPPSARPSSAHVLVIGGGFAGYFATRNLCRTLRNSGAHVTLVSDTDAMLYQPLLPDVAVGAIEPRSAAVPLNTTLRRAHVIRGRATAVRLEDRIVKVHTASRTVELPYDYLLLAVGGVTRMFDIPGLAEHAVGFKTAAEALYLRELVLLQLEAGNSETDATLRRAKLTFVIVGAGYAGTELAAQMVRLTDNLLPDFPLLHRGDVKWLLLDMATAIMPELGKRLGDEALRLLRRRGVDVRLHTSLTRVLVDSVQLTDGTILGCSTVIWCAGVTANPLVTGLGLPLDHGRLVVGPTLNIAAYPEVFAIGDAAAVPDLASRTEPQKLCPPTAQHAMRQAAAAARNIAAGLHGTPLCAYRHHDLGLVVDLGGAAAVATPIGIKISGWPAKLVTRGYHLYALPTLKRRLSVLTGWVLAGKRPNDVTFGLVQSQQALAANNTHTAPATEHRPQPTTPRGPAAG